MTLKTEFADEMGQNGMADLAGRKEVGPFIIELYTNTVLTGGAVVQVFRERRDEAEHWRRFKSVGKLFTDELNARDRFNRLEAKEHVARFITDHPE